MYFRREKIEAEERKKEKTEVAVAAVPVEELARIKSAEEKGKAPVEYAGKC